MRMLIDRPHRWLIHANPKGSDPIQLPLSDSRPKRYIRQETESVAPGDILTRRCTLNLERRHHRQEQDWN